MKFFTTAASALLMLLGLAAENEALAQPQVPSRPRTTSFGGIFGPRSPAVPNAGLGMNQQGGQGFGQNNAMQGGQGVSAYGVPLNQANSNVPPRMTGQPAVFNNLGHWYSGNLGHWYPNGLRSGAGAVGNSGATGGGMAGGGAGPRPSGLGTTMGTMGTTGMGIGIAVGGFRR